MWHPQLIVPRNQLTPQGLSPHPIPCLWLAKFTERLVGTMGVPRKG